MDLSGVAGIPGAEGPGWSGGQGRRALEAPGGERRVRLAVVAAARHARDGIAVMVSPAVLW